MYFRVFVSSVSWSRFHSSIFAEPRTSVGLNIQHFYFTPTKVRDSPQLSKPHLKPSQDHFQLTKTHSQSTKSDSHNCDSHSQLTKCHSHNCESHFHNFKSHSHNCENHFQLTKSHSHNSKSHSHNCESHSHNFESHSHKTKFGTFALKCIKTMQNCPNSIPNLRFAPIRVRIGLFFPFLPFIATFFRGYLAYVTQLSAIFQW